MLRTGRPPALPCCAYTRLLTPQREADVATSTADARGKSRQEVHARQHVSADVLSVPHSSRRPIAVRLLVRLVLHSLDLTHLALPCHQNARRSGGMVSRPWSLPRSTRPSDSGGRCARTGNGRPVRRLPARGAVEARSDSTFGRTSAATDLCVDRTSVRNLLSASPPRTRIQSYGSGTSSQSVWTQTESSHPWSLPRIASASRTAVAGVARVGNGRPIRRLPARGTQRRGGSDMGRIALENDVLHVYCEGGSLLGVRRD